MCFLFHSVFGYVQHSIDRIQISPIKLLMNFDFIHRVLFIWHFVPFQITLTGMFGFYRFLHIRFMLWMHAKQNICSDSVLLVYWLASASAIRHWNFIFIWIYYLKWWKYRDIKYCALEGVKEGWGRQRGWRKSDSEKIEWEWARFLPSHFLSPCVCVHIVCYCCFS